MTELGEIVSGDVVWTDGSLEVTERIIARGLSSFVEVGAALGHIRDRRLYIEAGFDTFEDYCRQRWDLSRAYANNQIASAQVVDVCARIHGVEPPPTEFHARPLAKVLNEDGEQAVITAWKQIIAKHQGDGPITGREISRFLTYGEGANYGKPGWNELLGQVGDTLLKAQKELSKFESAVGERKVNASTREKAARYAGWAEDLADRLREQAA